MKSRPRIIVVCGPTASGKSALALLLAQHVGGEIVNADSRQVYRHMDIGTAKPSLTQRSLLPHHLFDCADPSDVFTLANYLELARPVIDDIATRGKLPVVVGGTGLYLRAVVRGFDVPAVPPNIPLRVELEALRAESGLDALRHRLRVSDAAAADRVDPKNPRRLIRAIEVAECKSDARTDMTHHDYDALWIGVTASLDELYRRADGRVEAMIKAGLVEEVVGLRQAKYAVDSPSMSSLGYKQVGDYLDGLISLTEAVQTTKFATHKYIRRQLTWFRQEGHVAWLDVAHGRYGESALGLIHQWLNSTSSNGADLK